MKTESKARNGRKNAGARPNHTPGWRSVPVSFPVNIIADVKREAQKAGSSFHRYVFGSVLDRLQPYCGCGPNQAPLNTVVDNGTLRQLLNVSVERGKELGVAHGLPLGKVVDDVVAAQFGPATAPPTSGNACSDLDNKIDAMSSLMDLMEERLRNVYDENQQGGLANGLVSLCGGAQECLQAAFRAFHAEWSALRQWADAGGRQMKPAQASAAAAVGEVAS